MNEYRNYRYIDVHRAHQEDYVPLFRVLFNDDYFSGLSNEAKILYSLMRGRIQLSLIKKGNWIDSETGFAFIYYPIEEAAKQLSTSRPTTIKVFDELEEWNMIDRRKKKGKATRIYVKDIFSRLGEEEMIPYDKNHQPYKNDEYGNENVSEFSEKSEKQTSTSKKILPVEIRKTNFQDETSKEILPVPVKKFNPSKKNRVNIYNTSYNTSLFLSNSITTDLNNSADIINSREGKKESDTLDYLEIDVRYGKIKDPMLDVDTFQDAYIKLAEGYVVKDLGFAKKLAHDLLDLSNFGEGGFYETLGATNKGLLNIVYNIFIEALTTDQKHIRLSRVKEVPRYIFVDRLLQIKDDILPKVIADLQERKGQTIKSPTKYMRKLLYNAPIDQQRITVNSSAIAVKQCKGWVIDTKWDGYEKPSWREAVDDIPDYSKYEGAFPYG